MNNTEPMHAGDIIQRSFGFEEIIVNNERYCGKRLTVLQGYRSSKHLHGEKHETFWVTEGAIRLEIWLNDEVKTRIMVTGDKAGICPGTPHRFTGILPFNRFLEFSSPDRAEDTVRMEPGGPTCPDGCVTPF